MSTSYKLFSSRTFDRPDNLEEEWAVQYMQVLHRMKALAEDELTAAMKAQTLSSPEPAPKVLIGLLYGILVDSTNCTKYFKVLGSVTREHYGGCVDLLKPLVGERFPRLLDLPRAQLIWIVASMIQMKVSEVEVLFTSLLRQVVTGNVTTKNLGLVSELLTMMTSNRDWLYSHPALLAPIAYTLASIIPDHHKSDLESLRERETAFIVQLFRERLDAVRLGGRDLIRVLYNISLIPDIKNIWDQVLLAPSEHGNAPNNLRAFLSTPTPKHVLASRITPEIETWLTFLLTRVKSGPHQWHQKWFASKFFSSPENDTLIPELIRWIIGAHHPSNAVLQSSIIPRYKVIGWLIGGCARNPHVQQNARQALFYDWLFYTPTKDNIMNIEPAALLVMNTLQKEPPFVTALTEYLMISTDNYLVSHYPPMREELRRSVHLASRLMLEKKVITTFDPLYTNSHLPQNLRDALKKVFETAPPKAHAPQPTQRTTQESAPAPAPHQPSGAPSPVIATTKLLTTGAPTAAVKKSTGDPSPVAKISPKPSAESIAPAKTPPTPAESSGDTSMFGGWKAALSSSRGLNGTSDSSRMDVDFPDSDARRSQEIMVPSSSNAFQYAELLAAVSSRAEVGNVRLARNALETFLKSDVAEAECSSADLAEISNKLLLILTPELTEQVPATLPTPVSFVHTQLFISLAESYQNRPVKSKKTPFAMQLLVALRAKEKSFGWRLLTFLFASEHSTYPTPLSIATASMDQAELFETFMNAEDEKANLEQRQGANLLEPKWTQLYTEYLKITSKAEDRDEKEVFVDDMRLLVGASVSLANDAFPLVCRYLPTLCLDNEPFIHIMIQSLLPQHMASLHADLSSQTFKLFGDNLTSVIRASLKWDSYCQQLFWNLVSSEYLFQSDTIIESLQEMLTEMEPTREALQGSLALLSHVGPVSQLIQCVVSLDVRYYEYTTMVFLRWMVEDEFQTELAKRLPSTLNTIAKADTTKLKSALMNLALANSLMPSDFATLLEHAPLRKSILTHLSKKTDSSSTAFDAIKTACAEREEKDKAAETKKGAKKRTPSSSLVIEIEDSNSTEIERSGSKKRTPSSSLVIEIEDSNSREIERSGSKKRTSPSSVVVEIEDSNSRDAGRPTSPGDADSSDSGSVSKQTSNPPRAKRRRTAD